VVGDIRRESAERTAAAARDSGGEGGASAVASLLSDRSEWITGQVLSVDSGTSTRA
jgi:hypothetical protein